MCIKVTAVLYAALSHANVKDRDILCNTQTQATRERKVWMELLVTFSERGIRNKCVDMR